MMRIVTNIRTKAFNPTSDYFEFNATGNGMLSIYNFLGNKVGSLKTIIGNNRFELKSLRLSQGCYLLRYQDETITQSCKLIIE